jgi:protein-disulfide isomerase
MEPSQNNEVAENTNSEEHLSKKERRALKRQERKEGAIQQNKSQAFKRILIWGSVVAGVVGLVFLFIWVGNNAEPVAPPDGDLTTAVSLTEDQTYGNHNAKVTLVEYSDFQCPACASYFPIVGQLKEDYKDDLLFVYRHYPLTRIHPNAEPAAEAAEAAALQGTFWEMHDLLFERQDAWSKKPLTKSTFISYAEELGLDIEQFEADLKSDEISKKISSQLNAGTSSGVTGTPSFFLDGKKIPNPRSYEEFSTIIANAITEAGPVEIPTEVPNITSTSTEEVLIEEETTNE